jgi:hypothetical protein
MLLVRAWVDAGVLAPFDPRPYPPTWYMHHSEERYLAWMQTVAVEVPMPRPGDVVLWRFGLCFSHCGILIDDAGNLVHAWADTGQCDRSNIETARLKYLGRGHGRTMRPRKFFDVFARIRQSAP